MPRSALRLVLDTNTALSGLVWRGTPSRVIAAAEHGRVTIATSDILLAELHLVMSRRKFVKPMARQKVEASERFETYKALAVVVLPASIQPAITRDPADDHVLAAALGANADLIVSGDAHLLDLKRYLGIHIVTAAEAVARIEAIP